MQEYEIGDFIGDAGFDQLLDFVASTIESLGVGKKQFDFLGKLLKTRRRVAGCRHHDFRIRHPGPSILVILMRRKSFTSLNWNKMSTSERKARATITIDGEKKMS